jgi:Prephenate dehydratase
MTEAEYLEKMQEVRAEIDAVDRKLLPLLRERMLCSEKVAAIKKEAQMPVFDPVREKQILDRICENGGEFGESLSAIYAGIMSVSRARQHNILSAGEEIRTMTENALRSFPKETVSVVCQGVEGAYSHKATKSFFSQADISFCALFEDAFKQIEENKASFAVLPVENSAAGSVSEVYDHIMKYRFHIVGAVVLPVKHCAAGVNGRQTAKKVVSHPQALRQCSEYIKANELEEIEFSNTAAAAKYVKEKADSAFRVICSEEAAEKYGLQIIHKNIQNERSNATRFIVISKTPILPENADKISLCFSLPHEAGSLYSILEKFSVSGLNLTKIESRPIPERQFEYDFYLDFTGNIHDEKTKNLICALNDDLPHFSFLGNYAEINAE